MNTLTTPKARDLQAAVDDYITQLNQRDAEKKAAEEAEEGRRQRLCRQAALALATHLRETEGVETDPDAWEVIPNEYYKLPANSYDFQITFQGITGDPGDDESYNRYQAVKVTGVYQYDLELLKDICVGHPGWAAWHHSGRCQNFDTFVAAATYALTGRK